MESGRHKALLFQHSCPRCQNYGSAVASTTGKPRARFIYFDPMHERGADLLNTASFESRLAAGLGEFASGGNVA